MSLAADRRPVCASALLSCALHGGVVIALALAPLAVSRITPPPIRVTLLTTGGGGGPDTAPAPAPVVQAAPPAPAPVVAVPKPPPPRPHKRPAPRAARKSTAPSEPVAAVAPAPAPVPIAPASDGEGGAGGRGSGPGTGGGSGGGTGRGTGRGTGSGSADAVSSYLGRLRQRIEQAKQYPLIARRRGVEGRAAVAFEVTRSGKIRELRLASSTDAILGEAALRAVEAAAPFPAPPPEIADDALRIQIALRFTLHETDTADGQASR